ncbi:MAG: hypothetical protein U0Z26_11705 [Anaerolineales bacterium]
MKATARPSQIALIVLTTITALLHFERAIEDPEIRILFILNGLGFFALVAAFYLPMFQKFHKLVRWTFIIYTAVTILLYFVWVAMSGEWTVPVGPIAKLVEAAMIYLLLREP